PTGESRPPVHAYGLYHVPRTRVADGLAISHNKFIVRTGTDGKARAVWTGSTNFTAAGVYAQSNVGHPIVGAEPAGTYLKRHQLFWNEPTLSCARSRIQAHAMSAVPDLTASPNGTSVVFSPRASIEAVKTCAALVG